MNSTDDFSSARIEQLIRTGSAEQLEKHIFSLCENDSVGFFAVHIMASALRAMDSVPHKPSPQSLVGQNRVLDGITRYDSHENVVNDLISLCLNARSAVFASRKRDSEMLCDKVLHIIDTEYDNEQLSLSHISARLGVSPNYLSTLVKKHTGKNFVALLTSKRMENAKELLLCTNLRVLEIAAKCGYTDQHYFCSRFKIYFGEPPAKMRRRLCFCHHDEKRKKLCVENRTFRINNSIQKTASGIYNNTMTEDKSSPQGGEI